MVICLYIQHMVERRRFQNGETVGFLATFWTDFPLPRDFQDGSQDRGLEGTS
jgi:hypothetical protein